MQQKGTSGRTASLASWAMLLAGAVLAAFAVEEFLAPNDLFDGGVVGVSMIGAHLTGLPLGLLNVALNLPFLVLGARKVGRRFVAKAGFAMAVFSLCTELFAPLAQATSDTLLATAFGGVLLGAGVGLVLRGGGCLDGTEIVGVLVNRARGVSVGTVVLAINVGVYAAAGALFGPDRGMYSLIMYFIGSRVIDMVEMGGGSTKSALIVTDHGSQLADLIYERLGRTVTYLSARGYVSGQNKDVLYCVVTRAEVFGLKEIIDEVPGSSFTTISEVSEIVGAHLTTEEAEAQAKGQAGSN